MSLYWFTDFKSQTRCILQGKEQRLGLTNNTGKGRQKFWGQKTEREILTRSRELEA